MGHVYWAGSGMRHFCRGRHMRMSHCDTGKASAGIFRGVFEGDNRPSAGRQDMVSLCRVWALWLCSGWVFLLVPSVAARVQQVPFN